jgi:hypothetical protein
MSIDPLDIYRRVRKKVEYDDDWFIFVNVSTTVTKCVWYLCKYLL